MGVSFILCTILNPYNEIGNSCSAFKPGIFHPVDPPETFRQFVFNIPHENPDKNPPASTTRHLSPGLRISKSCLTELYFDDYLGSENPDEEYGNFFKKEKRITSDYFNWFYQFSLFSQSATTKES